MLILYLGNKTEQRVIQILRELVANYRENNKQPLNYFRFVLDPNSYPLSVENIFHVSFLIKVMLIKFSITKFFSFSIKVY